MSLEVWLESSNQDNDHLCNPLDFGLHCPNIPKNLIGIVDHLYTSSSSQTSIELGAMGVTVV